MPSPVSAPKTDFARLCGDYSRLGGKSFLGDEGAISVQAWVKSCERIFRFMDLTDL